jgi:dCMP deaminase
MGIAYETAKLSYAEKMKVGCVAVKDDNILAFGYNGTPPGWDNQCEDIIVNPDGLSELKTKQEVIHAEMNCLMKLSKNNESSADATIFLTHSPCFECSKGIFLAGIKEVYYSEEYRKTDGIDFLKKCNIKVEKFDSL